MEEERVETRERKREIDRDRQRQRYAERDLVETDNGRDTQRVREI